MSENPDIFSLRRPPRARRRTLSEIPQRRAHAALALIAVAALLCCNARDGGDGSNGSAKASLTSVRTSPAEATTEQREQRFSGYVHPWEARGLGFMVGGQVVSLNVRAGERVERGQLLGTLDASDYRLVAQLADVQIEALKPNLDRVDELVRDRVLPQAKMDEIRGQYQAATVQKQRASRQVAYTRLLAPRPGVVMELKTSVGQVVGQGMPAVILLEIDRLKVKFGVTQKDLGLFQKGEEVSLTFPGVAGERKGSIHHIALVPDTKTRTYEVVVAVDNQDAALRPGMLAHLHVVTEQETGIFVPLLAVKRNAKKKPVVYVLESQRSTVVEREVDLGALFADQILIKEGLDKGELVIVEGQSFVSAGDEVRPL